MFHRSLYQSSWLLLCIFGARYLRIQKWKKSCPNTIHKHIAHCTCMLVLYGVFSTCTELVSSRAFFHKYTTKGSRGPEEHSQQSCIKYTYLSGNPKDDFLKKRKVSWCFLSSLLRYMIAEIALLLPSVMLHLLMM